MNELTLLLRQINPSFIEGNKVKSQAFRPTPKDKKRLSVYDGDQIEPQAAWEHYTQILKYKSEGLMGISLGECRELALEAQADPKPFPEHVLIDFTGLSRGEVKKKAQLLRDKALKRDWLYRAEWQN